MTALAFIAFYFSDSMPDHLYAVSSTNRESGTILFALSSLFVLFGEYTGPWIFLPFVIFTLYFSFLYSSRSYFFDAFNLLWLVFASFFLCYLLIPESIGDGLRFWTNLYFETSTIISSLFFFTALFLIGSHRNNLKEKIVLVFTWFITLPLKTWKSLVRSDKTAVRESLRMNYLDGLKSIKLFFANKLKSDSSQLEKLESKEGPYLLDESYEIEDEEDTEDEEEEVLVSDEKNQEEPSLLKKETKSPKKPVNQFEAEKLYFKMVKSMPGLKKGAQTNQSPDESYFNEIITQIEDKLNEFKIDAKIINILKGPVVDTFELELGAGVKVSRISSAEDDLSLALYGAPVRIVYPMIGKTTVGIEVPRRPRDVIYLDDVLRSIEFRKSSYRLPIAMGKNAFGETTVVDLAAMPHMLIAGATGAGKSVFINTLLVSLLIKKSPQQMKLILIDPKQLELALYHKLPHLILPVVTDAKRAAISLVWACQEMDRRYSILKEMGVRGIDSYNEKIDRATPEQLAMIHPYFLNGDEEGYALPYIVIIIDEFADLILTKAGKEIEINVSRLAAKARAAGIHLVLATQRPSVDVITGVIKSNFPTRVSFRVTGINDSRTILDAKGAEKLLGKGDMLYKYGTSSMRLHSAYIDESDVEQLVESLCQIPPQFDESALNFIENGGEAGLQNDPYAYPTGLSMGAESGDDRFDEALQIVLEQGVASASMLQRMLRIGYNRAANLIDELEAKGVIGPAQGSKPRKVIGPPDAHP